MIEMLAKPHKAKLNRSAALASLVIGALLIAFAPILVRLSETGPVASGFWRVVLAMPVLMVLLQRESRGAAPLSGAPDGQNGWWPALAAGLLLALDLGVWHVSIGLTSIANATVFNNGAPFFVALFLTVAGRAPQPLFWLALAVALAGMALMMGGHMTITSQHLWGDILAIATGAFYGGYILLIRQVRQYRSTLWCMAVSTGAAVPVLLAFAWGFGERIVPTTPWGWGVVIALGLICHVGGQGLITRALALLPATFSSMTLLIQPIAAGLIAWVLFGEAQTIVQLVGAALVLAGIMLANRVSS